MERELILSKLTMKQVLEFYAPRKIHKNRCACPIHNGNDDNFQIYKDSFNCWVCHSAGDFIKFVSELFKISYSEAMRKIDIDFNLGVYNKPTLTQYRKNQRQVLEYRKRQEKAEQDKLFKEMIYQHYVKEEARMRQNLMDYKPSENQQSTNYFFTEALLNLQYIEYLLNTYDWRCESE